MTLKSLRTLVEAAKAKNPKKPIYSDAIKDGVRSFGTMPIRQLSKKVGVSQSFISKVRKTEPKEVSKSVKNHKKTSHTDIITDPTLQFFQLTQDQQQFNTTTKPSMKVTTPQGLVIEIWG